LSKGVEDKAPAAVVEALAKSIVDADTMETEDYDDDSNAKAQFWGRVLHHFFG
jgi:hypothetical protein